jgi:hypothetical protein
MDPSTVRTDAPARPVAAVLRFAGAFAVVAATIGANLPWPRDAQLGARIAHFAADPAGYDAVFVGASGIYRGLDPTVIDAELAERGLPLRTYNLAAPGMSGFEADGVLRAALAARGERLRYAFVEPGPWNATLENQNVGSYRFLYWHTPRATAAAVRSAWATPLPLEERLLLVWTHVRIAARRAAGFGSAEEFAHAWFELDPPSSVESAAVASGGFLSLDDDPDPLLAQRHAKFLEQQAAEFDGLVRALERARARPLESDALRTHEFLPHDAQAEAVAAVGATIVHVLPPYTTHNRAFDALVRDGRIVRLLAFNDPKRFAGLYTVERRHDREHLTEEGAQAFSTVFAREFARAVRAGEIPEVSRP